MRQCADPGFRQLLGRARSRDLTSANVHTPNAAVLPDLSLPEFERSPAVVRSNELRHHLNRLRLELFARRRNQKIFVFPALHARINTRSKDGCPPEKVQLDQLFAAQDDNSKSPSAGLFFYTPGMPVMLLAKLCSWIGHVNGAIGTAEVLVPQRDRKLTERLFATLPSLPLTPSTVCSQVLRHRRRLRALR